MRIPRVCMFTNCFYMCSYFFPATIDAPFSPGVLTRPARRGTCTTRTEVILRRSCACLSTLTPPRLRRAPWTTPRGTCLAYDNVNPAVHRITYSPEWEEDPLKVVRSYRVDIPTPAAVGVAVGSAYSALLLKGGRKGRADDIDNGCLVGCVRSAAKYQAMSQRNGSSRKRCTYRCSRSNPSY